MNNTPAPWLCSELAAWLNWTAGTLTVGFIAACIWLPVRIANRRERWAACMLVMVISPPLVYILSFGPACWWFATEGKPRGTGGGFSFDCPYAPRLYWPIGRLSICGPRPVQVAIGWYATRRSDLVMLPFEPDGSGWVGAR